MASIERREQRVREELLARCRAQLIEPPTPDRVGEITRSALHRAEQALLRLIAARVDAATIERLEALIAVSDDDDDGEDVLALIKAAPGNVSLDTVLVEIAKLEAIRAIELPSELFADVAPTVVAGWRARAMVESPSHLREHPQPTKLALLCALLVLREREVTDTLAQLLISTIHRINAHAEQKVVEEFVNDFRRVRGKDTMLRRIAEASLKTPDDTVREVIYPVVGGEATLTDLVNEYRATGTENQRQKRKVFKASYTNHYRRGLIRLLGVLEFRSNNTAHQPVIDALGLIVRYAYDGGTYYPFGEHVVLEGAVNADWTELLTKIDSRGRDRVVRGVYEACVFQALRERLRCKEIWVVGAHEWRNPDEDLPTDFEVHRAEHYDKLRKPLDPAVFTAGLREEMRTELNLLNDALLGHAEGPRAATGDRTFSSQTNRSTSALRVSPPPAREPTGSVGRHRPTRVTMTLRALWDGADAAAGRCRGDGSTRFCRPRFRTRLRCWPDPAHSPRSAGNRRSTQQPIWLAQGPIRPVLSGLGTGLSGLRLKPLQNEHFQTPETGPTFGTDFRNGRQWS